jgi:hypothetical protein
VGTYLDEAMIPVMRLIDAGYTVTFATPSGGPAHIDPHSDSASSFASKDDYQRAHELWRETLASSLVPISRLASEDIDADENEVSSELDK